MMGRAWEIYKNESIIGIINAVLRTIYWNLGIIKIHYRIVTVLSIPLPVAVNDHECRFKITSFEEMKRCVGVMGEREILEIFLHRLDETDVVWDIGANVGIYSCFSSQIADQVIAFEPHPANFQRLRENVSLNKGSVECRNIALSNFEGTVAMTDQGSAGYGENKVVPAGEIEVKAKCGDNIKPVPDVIKIDVEGHESAVVKGLKENLPDIRFALIEVHDQKSRGEVRDILLNAGMEVEQIGDRGKEVHLLGERNSN